MNYSVKTLPLSYLNWHEVHVVFDQYWENSIKNNECSRRGASTALEVKISSSATPIPKQWDKYISNCKNKTNLCEFVSEAKSKDYACKSTGKPFEASGSTSL